MNPISPTTKLDRKATFKNLYERLFNEQEFPVADELATADFVDHAAPPSNPHGPDGLKSLVRWIHSAFPDALYTVVDMVEEGDKLFMWTILSGTHMGNFMGNPPTGKTFSQDQMHLLRMEGSKIAEHWAVRDDLKMMQQLGILPDRELLTGSTVPSPQSQLPNHQHGSRSLSI